MTTDHTDDVTAAIAVSYAELAELLGLAGTAAADLLDALAATLAGAHVWTGLTDRDARGIAELLAYEVIAAGWDLSDAAAAIHDRADAALLDRDLDDRTAVGLALHRAAAVLETDDPFGDERDD